jgi:hypothetical protein
MEEKSAQKKSNCTNWSAIHDFMPPGPARLTVTGECTFPTPGYKVTLKKKEPQGINPRILILEKTVTKPTHPEPDVVTKQKVEYKEKTDVHYSEVQIVPDGELIKVQEVH